MRILHRLCWLVGALLAVGTLLGQIDPDKRKLVQAGYTQPLQGQSPVQAYAYFYWNEPYFPWTNTTLRTAVAPTYVDAELGFRDLLRRGTSVGLGVSGGAFADNYAEINESTFLKEESFFGMSGGINASLYHTFNPTEEGKRPSSIAEVPLQLILRNTFRGVFYSDQNNTSPDFELPDNQPTYNLRTGLRWGGREPLLSPTAAFEASVWYDLEQRGDPGAYGFDGDRNLERTTQRYWARLLFYWTFTNQMQLQVNLTGGSSTDADRLSAYRLGGSLPVAAEFPLMIPGYFNQEISAKHFALLHGMFLYPLTSDGRWKVGVVGSSANVSYLPGFSLGQPWNSGVGGGVKYTSPSGAWQFVLSYGHGFNAIRSGERGADSVTLAIQYDFLEDRGRFFQRLLPAHWRGSSF